MGQSPKSSADPSKSKVPLIIVKAEPEYVQEESHPNLNHYFFAYHIRIINKGNAPAQLLSRHWLITNGNGAVHEVQGEGVVGKQPVLLPGEEFNYTSACPLDTPTGMMQGEYHMIDSDGHPFEVEIEPFMLNSEQLMN